MRIIPLAAQRQTLRNPKTVLFIDDHQPQPGVIHSSLNQRMRPYNQLRIGCRSFLLRAFGLAAQTAAQPGQAHPQRHQPASQLLVMLFGENLRRCHEGHLPASSHCLAGRQRRNNGLASAHITLQQPLHRIGLGQIGGDLRHCALLRAGQGKGQYRQQRLGQSTIALQHWGALLATGEKGTPQRHLLRQRLIELEPAPRRVVPLLQGSDVGACSRVMQEAQAARKPRQLITAANALRQGIRQVIALKGALHKLG